MENNIEIPIYRARKKYNESHEEIKSGNYVIGYLCEYHKNEFFIQPQGFGDEVEIDPATLAINSADTKDSENNPIFASLSTSGKGGDILKDDFYLFTFCFIFKGKRTEVKCIKDYERTFLTAPKYSDSYNRKDLKIIGIQE